MILKTTALLVVGWVGFIITGGELASPNKVLETYKAKALVTSHALNDSINYASDSRIIDLANHPDKEERVTSPLGEMNVDKMYTAFESESDDSATCDMIMAQENGDSFLLYGIAVKMPLIYVLQSRGSSTALQTAIGEIMSLTGRDKLTEVWYTTATSALSKNDQCRLILSNIKGRFDNCSKVSDAGLCEGKLIVRFNIQGAEAIAQTIFQSPVKALNICQKATLAASYNRNLSRYNWPASENSLGLEERATRMVKAYRQAHSDETYFPEDNCANELKGPIKKVVFNRLKEPRNHLIYLSKKLARLNASSTTEPKKFLAFHEGMAKTWTIVKDDNPQWSPETQIEVSINKNNHPYLHYGSSEELQKFGANSKQSLGSVAKLLALLLAAIKDELGDVIGKSIPGIVDKHHDVSGKKISLSETYCLSLNQGVYAMTQKFDKDDELVTYFDKYGFQDSANNSPNIKNIQVALSTERSSASTENLQKLIYDLSQQSLAKPNLRPIATSALGADCTLSAARDLLGDKTVLVAKTGTYERSNTITHKLAVWSWRESNKQNDIYSVVIRVIRAEGSGVCRGDGCISQQDLIPIFKYVIASA